MANGRPCRGCGTWVYFKKDVEGKMSAYDNSGNVHKCPEFEEMMRLNSDANLIEMAKTMTAALNRILRTHRLRLIVLDEKEAAAA